ncbi:hypothetical protein CLOP_g11254 [Closterium sp. NIES-67]|nr:hypothetical protein CLOP_g11254 [Closterium sp. NIES-67]
MIGTEPRPKEMAEQADWDERNTVQVAGKIKTDEKGEPSVYKSRLVAKGFQQKEKEDYKELVDTSAWWEVGL